MSTTEDTALVEFAKHDADFWQQAIEVNACHLQGVSLFS
jgi:hypothetical protein